MFSVRDQMVRFQVSPLTPLWGTVAEQISILGFKECFYNQAYESDISKLKRRRKDDNDNNDTRSGIKQKYQV